MSATEFRPTFILTTEVPEGVFMKRLRDLASGEIGALTGQFTSTHAMIAMPYSQRHFWSPWLHVEIRPIQQEPPSSSQTVAESETGTGEYEVFGRFSPHPSVWTAFMFSYLALSVLCFFAAVFGASQWTAGQAATGFYLVPICLVGALALWIAARIGQKLSESQMITLKEAVIRCLDPKGDGATAGIEVHRE